MTVPIFFRSLQAIYGDDNTLLGYKTRPIAANRSPVPRQKHPSPVYDLTIHHLCVHSTAAFKRWKMNVDLLIPLRTYSVVHDEFDYTNVKCLFDDNIEAQRAKDKLLMYYPNLKITIQQAIPFITI